MHLRRIALAALLLAPAAPPRAAPPAYGDQATFERIEALRPVAAAIAIDGSDADWAGIPALADPAGDAGSFADRDITSVSIAPLDDALLVRIATAAPPASDGVVFWLEIDYRGEKALDLQIGLYPGFPDILWTYPENAAAAFQYWSDSQLAIGNVVEARIPYAALAPALPTEMASALSGPSARGWVRVRVFSVGPDDPFPEVDEAFAASYRLVQTPFALDPPRPAPGGAAVPLAMPLDALWMIVQGPFTQGSHAGSWAWDLGQVDAALHESQPDPSTLNTDYYAFGQPVHAPLAGPVRFARGSEPDQPPRTDPPPGALANLVQIDAPGNRSVSLYHLQQGSVLVSAGANVSEGQLVGRVGNSVNAFSWPHLHLQAEAPAGGTDTQPIALREVEVQLNPGDADPWERRLASWEPREGMLVRPARALCGDLNVDRALDAADAALYRAVLVGGATLSPAGAARCSVIGSAHACSLVDSVVVRRSLAVPPAAPAIAQVCSAALGSTP
ncbi:MAG TPA: M23 family metallopeptidase [Myxococcota bacterium]|nr:M23 family metallopeptidase [Myxococcota bacterium]